MRHALVCLVACLLALPAAAQEQPAAPPAVETPAIETPATETPANADKPAEPDKPADAVADQPAEEPIKPVATTDAQNSICLLLESAARANGLPVEFFARVIWQESRFRPNAVGPMTRSGKRAQGIAQFMPGTAAERDLLNPFDPIQALPKSAEFLRDLRREFGNLGLAAAAYNAGPRRVREWLSGTGPMPSETRHYVHAITGATVEQWAKGERRLRQEAAGRLRLRHADGEAQARAEPVRRGTRATDRNRLRPTMERHSHRRLLAPAHPRHLRSA